MNAGPPPVRPAQGTPAESRALTVAEANFATIQQTLKGNAGAEARQIRAMFRNKDEADRFLAVAFALLSSNSQLLQRATPMSIVQSLRDAARLGLEPMTEEAAIVEYDGVAKLMPMWRGYLKRIRNSGQVSDVDAQLVYENDHFEYRFNQRGGEFDHVPVKHDRGGYWGAYAYATMPSGFVELEVMTEAEINFIRDRFAKGTTKPDSPWRTSWGEQARKTVIRRLAKRLPASAVNELLALDKANDEAADRLEAATARLTSEVNDVRQLALAAVGIAPAPQIPAEGTQPEGEGGAAPAEEPTGSADPRSAEGTPEHSVTGALAEDEEERRLREFRERGR